MADPLRLNRFLAECGLGSRRGVERFVREGRVQVNGELVSDLGRRVDPDQDEVLVDGRPVRPATGGVMLALYKPRGVLSSFASQDDRPCLLDLVPEHYREGRLFHIGRLDAYSTGLLLLGSDGDLANALLHPRHPVPKVYEVRADGPLDEATLRAWREGRTDLDGRPLQGVEVEEIGALRWRLTLREGRNRQIRRMFEAVRRAVLELHRTAFGPVQIGTMQPGEIRSLLPHEIDALRGAAGLSDGD